MKAIAASLLKFLSNADQFEIPIFQRTYSWTRRECRQLWEDILRTGGTDTIQAHFIGSIVYIQADVHRVINPPPVQVIDGQQRLTTVMLILEALARHLGVSEPVGGFSAKKVRERYLINPLEEGERSFKLLLTQTDKESLLALMRQGPKPRESSVRIEENFGFFQEWIKDLGDDLEPLCKGLEKLMIVDIALTRGQENPQLIFESMNSTGLDLTQADLIRNFILMGLEPRQQREIYEEHWRPMELNFGQETNSADFDGFMRHYLTVKMGEIPTIRAVYKAFKNHAQAYIAGEGGIGALVADIQTFAKYYCKMALNQEQDKELAAAFRDLRDLKVDVAYPFLLELYHDYASETLSGRDFAEAVKLVESYVFRRAVCGLPTSSHNNTFATLGRLLDKERYLESLQANLLTLPSYRRFPSDEEFKRELSERDLYNFSRRSYWLRRLENDGRKERVPIEYTIEHILPQNENLSTRWRKALGPDWDRVQKTWVHTLGNLTLTGYNPEFSDRPFPEKRDMPGGFKESPIRLNQGLGRTTEWNEDAIRERARILAGQALRVWRRPTLSREVQERYKKSLKRHSGYSLSDHHLAVGSPMRPLFDAFRKEVLALDPCVRQEVVKSYIAFKAETNFVDVVPRPQKKRLLLILNMPFHELHDPKSIAKDTTGISGWGNGDVEVGLEGHEDLPYIMGLVRQSFERQMGNSEIGP